MVGPKKQAFCPITRAHCEAETELLNIWDKNKYFFCPVSLWFVCLPSRRHISYFVQWFGKKYWQKWKIVSAKIIKILELYNRSESHRSVSSEQKMVVIEVHTVKSAECLKREKGSKISSFIRSNQNDPYAASGKNVTYV